jgi:hypothetical protein
VFGRKIHPGTPAGCLAAEAAPTRPHPGTPSTPPWNKIIDPVVAVADKVRDVATGRTTYPGDL